MRHRSSVQGLACRHRRLADLAVTFPGLLFALAVPRCGSSVAHAIDLAIRGVPLKTLADVTGIPLWLRRIPPEAFETPVGDLPDGELFSMADRQPLAALAQGRGTLARCRAHGGTLE